MSRIPIPFLSGGVMIALMLLAWASAARAQDDDPDDLPPHVIDVAPYPGEEVPGDQPVTVTFDQPMDRASVEAAWEADLSAPGEFTWAADDRSVRFIPQGGWPRATRIPIAIGTGARAANGLALEEPYEFFVQTVGRLEVGTVIPAPGAEGVAANATITVSFNRPVVPLVTTGDLDTLPNPLVLEPAVEGSGEWVNNSIYVFTPSKPLAGATTYTARISAGLTDVTGSVLEDDYTWEFSTLAPEVLRVWPSQGATGIKLDEPVRITFSQPMDRASTEAAFRLTTSGEPVAGSFTWSSDGSTMTFTPDAPLKQEATYSLELAPSARAASGEAGLREGLTYSFTTVPFPRIEATRPRNGERDVRPGGGVEFTFSTPMDTNTFEGKVEILEPSGVEWEPVVYGDRSLYLDFATQPKTRYTIVFRAGAQDIYGNAIATDYTLSFTTGEIEPRANLPWFGGRVGLTSAYREDTRIAVAVEGKPNALFTLYRVPLEAFGEVFHGWLGDESSFLRGITPVREWTETLDAAPLLHGTDQVLLASKDGGRLPVGVYALRMQVSSHDWPQWMALGVVSANLTLKRAPDEAAVWVTDLQSGEPLEGVAVTLYDANGRVLATATTNADGLVRLSAEELKQQIENVVVAVAESEDVYGVWSAWGSGRAENLAGYLYTDRPIYRPGETLYYRGALRHKDDMTYTLPRGETVDVRITTGYGATLLFEGTLPLSPFGTFNGEIDLPENAELGEGWIEVRYQDDYLAQIGFTLAEFRVPEYRVEVTTDVDTLIQGDPLTATIAASYYFGGPVSDATLRWTIWGDPAWFEYTGPGRYTFTDDTQEFYSRVELDSDITQTDSAGRVTADAIFTRAPAIHPMMITVEGEGVAESGQYIAGRPTLLAHPAEIYVGQRTDRYFGRAEQPLTVDLIAVTPDSAPVAEQRIDLTVTELRWERVSSSEGFGRYDWKLNEIEVAADRVTTGEDGTAQYTFTPPQAGMYRVRAVVRDRFERVNSSTLRLWVLGDRPVWWGRPSDTIDLVADKESYVPGETAQVLAPVPFSGTSYALIAVERAGIQSLEVRRVEGSTLLIELPLTEQHTPNVHVSVTLVKGVDDENPNPVYRTGAINLTVEPIHKRLEVTVTPSAELARPGDTVTLDVRTVGPDGKPVEAEVGIGVTDQAILSLRGPNSVSPEEAFYGQQPNRVSTTVALQALLDAQADEALNLQAERTLAAAPAAMPPMPTLFAADAVAEEAAMAGADGARNAPAVDVREDFQQTPLWAPRVTTGADGRASITLTLPDNLTTWRVDARGITTQTEVGTATADVMSTLPLLTRPVTPRFFVVGDRVTLASVINNNTASAQTVEATLEASGVTVESDVTQTVVIPSGGRARVEWNVTVLDVPSVDLTFYAIGEDGAQDAVKPTLATGPNGTIPVYRYTAPDTVGTGGVLRAEGARTEAISLPPRVDPDRGELTIKVEPSLAATTIDALDYLRNFKHQCIEQTVSRFLPNVMTWRALRDLGIEDAELESNLRTALNEAVEILIREQNPDGGWGWFAHMESNPYVTAYAALGLIEARAAGFDFGRDVIDRALNYVFADFVRPGIDTETWRLNRQAFYSYVLARGEKDIRADLDALHTQRLEMDHWARAFLLMAYLEIDPSAPQVADLISDLQTGAILSATGAHWEEAERDWWNWSTDTRTTAIALAALTRAAPELDILPNVVRWLMVAREGDHWATTQETAWSVMALTDWMVATGELKANYDYVVALNGSELGADTITPDDVRESVTLRVAVGDLLHDEINRLTLARSAGEGALYYAAHLQLRLPAAEADPISRGISVEREYFSAERPGEPVTSARAGEVVTVRVTITAHEDINYFVLEDPIPAGTEPVDTSLLTTSGTLQPPDLRPTYDPAWWWGWWYFDHTEMRDEQVNLYADWLPRGTYVYTYQVRATVPGEFQTMPSHAYAFYFPEVFGRSAGTLFTVHPEGQ